MGEVIRNARKGLGVTQKDLAMTSGTGLRFIIELEKGKATCQIGKALTALHTLGISINLIPPPAHNPPSKSRPPHETEPMTAIGFKTHLVTSRDQTS